MARPTNPPCSPTACSYPPAFLPDSNGGCYVAASHQLLYFKDTNGDGKADESASCFPVSAPRTPTTICTRCAGATTGTLHEPVHLHPHAHREPHGIARLNSAGIWRFDPHTYQLEVVHARGCNPWGHAWDDYGNSFFTDGAGFQASPTACRARCISPTPARVANCRASVRAIIRSSPARSRPLAAVPRRLAGRLHHLRFPRASVVHFKYNEAGAGFQTKEMPDLLRSTNVTFRPIDVKFGPDGALYIADWSNPIIQHGEVDFRDPRRDKEHGRIWRVTAKGRPVVKRPRFSLALAKATSKDDAALAKKRAGKASSNGYDPTTQTVLPPVHRIPLNDLFDELLSHNNFKSRAGAADFGSAVSRPFTLDGPTARSGGGPNPARGEHMAGKAKRLPC